MERSASWRMSYPERGRMLSSPKTAERVVLARWRRLITLLDTYLTERLYQSCGRFVCCFQYYQGSFRLPVDLVRKKLGEEVLVVGLELLYVRLGVALGVKVVGIEFANPA